LRAGGKNLRAIKDYYLDFLKTENGCYLLNFTFPYLRVQLAVIGGIHLKSILYATARELAHLINAQKCRKSGEQIFFA